MKQSEDLLRYLYLEYLGSLDFIANVVQQIQTQKELFLVFRYSMVDMIRSHGFEPEVGYPNHTQPVEQLIRQEVFTVQQDGLFGEIVKFDLNRYTDFVGDLKAKDRSYLSVSQKYQTFGEEGLRKAIQLVANQHKWKLAASDANVEPSEKPITSGRTSLAGRNYLVTEAERQSLVLGIRELQNVIEGADISQQDRAQALALVNAALMLSECPAPNWRVIRELLYSVAAVATIFGLAIQLAELIR